MKKINNEVNKKAFALPSHKKRNDSLIAYAFLAPALILFIVFTVAPFVMSLVLSFTDYNGVEFTKFSFDNFKNIIEDKRVYHVKVNKEIKDLDKKLLSITGIEKVSFLEGEYIVTTLKSSNMISKIVEIISKENIDIQNIFSEEPTLENVFLALTGKKLRE